MRRGGNVAELKDVSKMTDAEREIELGVDAQQRANNCLIDIKKILERWQCTIDPVLQMSTQGIKGTFLVVPLIKRPMG